MGEPGVFVFPEPPLPVSGFGAKPQQAKKPTAPKASPAAVQDNEVKSDEKSDSEE